jgi:Flp pilus assembly protein CpaB
MSSTPLLLGVRLRRLLVRTRVRRALVAVLALLTGIVVAGALRAADAARRQWGDSRVVAVARHDLAAGDVVGPGDVDLRDLPAVAVADEALAEAPVGAVTRHPVSAGEPLVAGRLGPDGLTGPAALVPEGHRAVAVPVGPLGRPPLQVGDQVDVLAVVPTEVGVEAESGDGEDEAGDGVPAVPLVERALVVDVADEAVTVAVPAELTPAVAYAATQGALVLALTGA